MLAIGLRKFLDIHAAASAIDVYHAVYGEHRNSPNGNKLESRLA
jgi:hypothetical protein